MILALVNLFFILKNPKISKRFSTRSGKYIPLSRLADEVLDPSEGYIDKSVYISGTFDTSPEDANEVTIGDTEKCFYSEILSNKSETSL